MGNVPHVFVVPPWNGDELVLTEATAHHLRNVLRLEKSAPVSYTDGSGIRGVGVWTGGRIQRGSEETVGRPTSLVVAVAPPRPRQRQRFLIEKLAELGVSEVAWLATENGRGRPPPPGKTAAWAAGALEQSRGAYLTSVSGPSSWHDLVRPLAVALPRSEGVIPTEVATLAIGPEAGFADSEIPEDAAVFDLGERILRVETAAVVAAAMVLLG